MRSSGRGRTLLLLVLLLALLTGGAWFHLDRFDPRITTENLQGQTPEEVIANLGPPRFDPRDAGWRETADEPLYLYYSGPLSQRYAIEFANGRVVRVKRARL